MVCYKYNKYSDILSQHGLFTWLGYLLSVLCKLTPTRAWLKLPEICFLKNCSCIWNKTLRKVTPVWQDSGVVLSVAATFVLIHLAWSQQYCLSLTAWIFAWIFLVDMIAYYASVLWFDDLRIRENEEHRKVWSHRRILFQAIINFTQSIYLFAILYHAYQFTVPFSQLLQHSFTVATTHTQSNCLSVPIFLMNMQVSVTIFFLVVVITVLASIGYNRPELSKSFDKQA